MLINICDKDVLSWLSTFVNNFKSAGYGKEFGVIISSQMGFGTLRAQSSTELVELSDL
jgi:hypothetical protein